MSVLLNACKNYREMIWHFVNCANEEAACKRRISTMAEGEDSLSELVNDDCVKHNFDISNLFIFFLSRLKGSLACIHVFPSVRWATLCPHQPPIINKRQDPPTRCSTYFDIFEKTKQNQFTQIFHRENRCVSGNPALSNLALHVYWWHYYSFRQKNRRALLFPASAGHLYWLVVSTASVRALKCSAVLR